jgi:hypothetical protein
VAEASSRTEVLPLRPHPLWGLTSPIPVDPGRLFPDAGDAVLLALAAVDVIKRQPPSAAGAEAAGLLGHRREPVFAWLEEFVARSIECDDLVFETHRNDKSPPDRLPAGSFNEQRRNCQGLFSWRRCSPPL